jgi:hypothetical protein
MLRWLIADVVVGVVFCAVVDDAGVHIACGSGFAVPPLAYPQKELHRQSRGRDKGARNEDRRMGRKQGR